VVRVGCLQHAAWADQLRAWADEALADCPQEPAALLQWWPRFKAALAARVGALDVAWRAATQAELGPCAARAAAADALAAAYEAAEAAGTAPPFFFFFFFHNTTRYKT
jgi:hypothetical protein